MKYQPGGGKVGPTFIPLNSCFALGRMFLLTQAAPQLTGNLAVINMWHWFTMVPHLTHLLYFWSYSYHFPYSLKITSYRLVLKVPSTFTSSAVIEYSPYISASLSPCPWLCQFPRSHLPLFLHLSLNPLHDHLPFTIITILPVLRAQNICYAIVRIILVCLNLVLI